MVLPIMTRVTTINVSASLFMLIQINNYLPCVGFCLGSVESKELRMRIIIDSGADMNNRNKNYHQREIHRCSDMVVDC